MKINTSCKGCVFSTGDQNGQTGCSLNRSKLLGVSETDSDGFFVLSRFCNAYRPDSWVDGLTLEESLNRNRVVMSEVYPRIGIFITIKDDVSSIGKLEQTISSIKFNPAYVVAITPKPEYNEDVLHLLDQHFGGRAKYHIVQMTDPEDVKQYAVIDEAFSHAQNGWVYITSCGEIVPEDLLDRIHEWVNVKMKTLIMVKPYKEMNGLLFQAFLFKFVNGNRTKIYQDEIKDSRSFVDKIEGAQERTGEKCVFTTEEFLND